MRRSFVSRSLIALALVAGIGTSVAVADSNKRIGIVDTTWRLMGANDAVVIDRFDDPKVQGVSCYVSSAQTGGFMGSLGMAENPARMSIACRATGPVKIVGDINKTQKGEVVFNEKASIFFKTIQVARYFDAEKNVLVYLVFSTKLIDGSPFNNVTAVAIN